MTEFYGSNDLLSLNFGRIEDFFLDQFYLKKIPEKLGCNWLFIVREHKFSFLARVILSKMTKSLKDGTSRRNADGDLIVALRFLPNIELIVSILALLKCGIAYVPIGKIHNKP